MELNTKRFGIIKIDPEEIINFTQGIYGFEDYHRYVIINHKDSIFSFLQSVDEPWLSFVIVMPELLQPDYQVALEAKYVKELELEDSSEGQVYVILTIPERIAEMTANLQAPLVINKKRRTARQVILMDGKYQTRHNVFTEKQRSAYEKQAQERAKAN